MHTLDGLPKDRGMVFGLLRNQHPRAQNIVFLGSLIRKLPELQYWSDPQLSSFPFTVSALDVL